MTPRPSRRPFLTAEWRHLAMLTWEVDRAALRPHLPAGVELDTYDGRALASVVGFRFLHTRVLGVAVPLHRDFDEINLRFYVRRRDPGGGWRRGVVFVREIVPRRAVAWVARVAYGEPYRAMPTRHRLTLPGPGACADERGGVTYAWRHGGRWHRLTAAVRGAPAPAADGSEEAFVTEHYWGYTRRRGGWSAEYEVAHPRWDVWRAEGTLACDARRLYGAGFAEALAAPPCSALVATGSPVSVFRGGRLDG